VSAVAIGSTAGGRSLLPLWLMVAVFALPVVAGWILYLNPELLPARRVNRGELIEPVRAWPPTLPLVRADGTAFDIASLRGRWVLLTAARAPCDDRCVARLAELRQIRLALGEGGLAVERLLVLAGDARGAAPPADALGGAELARLGGEAVLPLETLLGSGEDIWDRVYIVDPLGNLMMRYAADAPAKDVLKDTERLLKASRNWIKGAGYGHR
jgi:hypothetical protein